MTSKETIDRKYPDPNVAVLVHGMLNVLEKNIRGSEKDGRRINLDDEKCDWLFKLSLDLLDVVADAFGVPQDNQQFMTEGLLPGGYYPEGIYSREWIHEYWRDVVLGNMKFREFWDALARQNKDVLKAQGAPEWRTSSPL